MKTKYANGVLWRIYFYMNYRMNFPDSSSQRRRRRRRRRRKRGGSEAEGGADGNKSILCVRVQCAWYSPSCSRAKQRRVLATERAAISLMNQTTRLPARRLNGGAHLLGIVEQRLSAHERQQRSSAHERQQRSSRGIGAAVTAPAADGGASAHRNVAARLTMMMILSVSST